MKKFVPIPIDRKSFHSFFLVSLMTFLAKVAIVLKEVVMASRYGREDELDAFLIAFLLPAFVGSLLGSAMNSALIPVYVELKRGGRPPAGQPLNSGVRPAEQGPAQEFLAGISLLNLIAVGILATLTFLLGGLGLPQIASGFGEVKIELTIKLLAILTPYILLTGISALWSAVLNAQERYAVVLLTPVITPLLIVVLLTVFSSGGVMVLAYGVLAGALIETILLGALLRRSGYSLRPRWRGWTAPVREVVRQFLPAAAAGCLMGSVLIVDQSMAAMLEPGSVAALSYGNKAIGFLLALLTTALMTFLTPYFSKKMIDGGGGGSADALGGLLWRWLGTAFFLGLLCSLAIVVFSEPLARLIFYRGAFTLTDLRLVAGVQSQLAWQIPFYACAVILTRYIAAKKWNRILFIVAACNVTINILLNEFLMRRMGVEGIALATSLVHGFSLLLLLFFIYLTPAAGWIFFLRKITKFLYRYRGLSRVADLVRMRYIHSPLRFRIDDLDGDLYFDCALNEHISSQIFWRGDYSTGQLALLRKILKPGMVFLDAGANKGEFAVIAAKYVSGEGLGAGGNALPEGRVLAFEPMEKTANELKANIAANGFRHVQVVQQALGQAAGERVLYHTEYRNGEEWNEGTFTLYPREGLDKPCGKIELTTLDAWMRSDTGRIDVMKIDVEGGELDLLRGAVETIRQWRPVIFIEVNAITSKAAGYDQAELLRWLEGEGYRCERVGRRGKTEPVTASELKEFQNLVCWPATGKWGTGMEDGGRAAAQKIAFFIPDLRGGGAEKAVCHLLQELVRRGQGKTLELLLVNASGVWLSSIPPELPIVDLQKKRTLSALPGLVRYLRKNRPSVLVAHLSHANTIALLAKKIAGVDTRVIVVEHILLLSRRPSFFGKQWFLEWGMKKWYPLAAARVAVSEAAAADLTRRLGLAQGMVEVIYNPVVDGSLKELAMRPVLHPWLEKKEMPVFLAVGRLEPEKDPAILLEAFALVRKKAAVRLILLGEGSLRTKLEEQASRLGIEADLSMPGFEKNPYAYMARCDAFVLSSRSEGLSNVLIEALACGCPVISTDCPGGPREILQEGALGILTPVGDAGALAAAMIGMLQTTKDERQAEDRTGREDDAREEREGRNIHSGKEERMQRAAFFSSERAADAWLALLNRSRRQIVLHVITGLRTGGAERMLCRLLSAMDRQHWEPVVLSLTDGTRPEAWLREQGIPVHSLGMRTGTVPGPVRLLRLIRLVRRIRPDLIQGWMYHGNLAAQFAGRRLSSRPPVIWSIHHTIASLASEKKLTIALIRLGARLSHLPARIIYASQVSADQHRALGYRADKEVLIPYGVDPALYLPSAEEKDAVRKELGLSAADLVIGSLARYHPMKDHENFLRAAALLLKRYKAKDFDGSVADLRFVLAGTGVDNSNPALRSLIRELGLAGQVQLLGERQDSQRVLAALDIFTVSSSHGEALPIVLLEAMSCGVPCVTTDVGDAGRLVGDTGRVVPVRDPAALAGAWAELIAGGEEKRKGLGTAARARILTHYTLAAHASAYQALYAKLKPYFCLSIRHHGNNGKDSSAAPAHRRRI